MVGAFMRVKSLVFHNGVLETVEHDSFVLNQPYLLAKPLYVYVGLIEQILFNQYEPLHRNVIPGSSGVVRIIEDPYSGGKDLSGEIAVVKMFIDHKVVGLDVDGLLSTYVALSREAIYGYVNEPNPIHALLPYISYSIKLGDEAYGSTLIIGCGLPSILTGIYMSRFRGNEPVLICSDIPRRLKRSGLRIYRNTGDLSSSYDTIIVSYENYSFITSVLESTSCRKLIITPFSRLRNIPLNRVDEVVLKYMSSFDNVANKHVEELALFVKKIVRYISIDDLGKARELIPPRGYGLVIDLTSI